MDILALKENWHLPTLACQHYEKASSINRLYKKYGDAAAIEMLVMVSLATNSSLLSFIFGVLYMMYIFLFFSFVNCNEYSIMFFFFGGG